MKLELHEHISRLMYDHECVVVPDMGAFLTRYYSSEVNHATHMMRPPSRRVYFNASIRENDGLLAKSISYVERVTYNQALELIEKEVRDWKLTLKAGRKLTLAGIGKLYTDNADKVQFTPSLELNYHPASYGLSIFRSPAIQREAAIRKTIHKAIEKHTTTEEPQTEKKKAAGWVSWAAVLGPVILASAIGYAYFTTSPNAMENVAGFNWFNSSKTITTPVEDKEPAPEESIEESATPMENEASDLTTTAEESITTPVEPPEKTDPLEEAPRALAQGHYHIVVGSFKERINAQNYISELRSKGYDAYIAQGNTNFSRVAIGNFSNEDAARNALNGVKQNVHPNSWLYSN